MSTQQDDLVSELAALRHDVSNVALRLMEVENRLKRASITQSSEGLPSQTTMGEAGQQFHSILNQSSEAENVAAAIEEPAASSGSSSELKECLQGPERVQGPECPQGSECPQYFGKVQEPIESDRENKPADPLKPKSKKEESGLESRIGALWLNRVGITALLIGVISLLLYSFQFAAPLVRVICGFVISASLVLFSYKRKNAFDKQRAFYEGVNALGWALAYFVCYGMYFLEPLHITDSIVLELILLSSVACGSMANAVVLQSETSALISSSFAYGSLLICGSSVSSDLVNIVFLIIAGAVTTVTVKQRWHILLIVSCCFFFGSLYWHMGSSRFFNYSALSTPSVTLDACVTLGWLFFNLAICLLKQIRSNQRLTAIGTSLISAWCFTNLLTTSLALQMPWVERDVLTASVYASIGAIYLLTAKAFKRNGLKDLWALHLLMGLSLVNTGRWLKITNGAGLVFDFCEIPLLIALGLQFDIGAFRLFAAIWSLVTVFCSLGGMSTAMLGVGSAALCSHLYSNSAFARKSHVIESRIIAQWFYCVSNLFAIEMISQLVEPPLQLVSAILLVSINVLLCQRSQTVVRLLAIVASIILALMFAIPTLPPVASVILCMVITSIMYHNCRTDQLTKGNSNSELWKHMYAIGTSLLMFGMVNQYVPTNLISAGWGLEGFAMVVIGFALRERFLRSFGLLMFGIVILRLLFVDLGSAPSIARIVSFVLAGLFSLVCSYAYTWFGKNVSRSDSNQAASAL